MSRLLPRWIGEQRQLRIKGAVIVKIKKWDWMAFATGIVITFAIIAIVAFIIVIAAIIHQNATTGL